VGIDRECEVCVNSLEETSKEFARLCRKPKKETIDGIKENQQMQQLDV
jgi:hypothetical protein